jgi:hypothetical protein
MRATPTRPSAATLAIVSQYGVPAAPYFPRPFILQPTLWRHWESRVHRLAAFPIVRKRSATASLRASLKSMVKGGEFLLCFARSKRTWAGSADARPYRRFRHSRLSPSGAETSDASPARLALGSCRPAPLGRDLDHQASLRPHLKCQRLPCSGITKRTAKSLPASNSCSNCSCGCSVVSEYLM